MREVWVESGVGMAHDAGAAAWCFDLDLWGTCVQGETADDAIVAFTSRYGPAHVVQHVHGDEFAFDRDLAPATDGELAATLGLLERARSRALGVLALPDDVLDWDDPNRVLPAFARWRTIRQTLWHIADTESRYYLPCCGLPSRPRQADLADELTASAVHVRRVLDSMARGLVVRSGGSVWTSTKLLRRLAWHEPGEIVAIEGILARYRERSPG